MRFLLFFLAIFLPFATTLWLAQPQGSRAPDLPDEAPARPGEALLSGADLADEAGKAPFVGKILALEGLELRLIDKDQIRCYASLGKLVRHEGQPKVQGAFFALFRDNRLRLTIESPFVEGDPAQFIRPAAGEPRTVTFSGGVLVRDERGVEMARVNHLVFDLESLTLTSPDHVTLRMADRGLDLEGDGLFARVGEENRILRLEANISGSVPTGEAVARFSGRGPATIAPLARAGHFLLVLDHGAHVQHPLASADCARIEALVHEAGGGRELVRAVLTGQVAIKIDPEARGGLEQVSAQRVVLERDQRILLEGEVRAVRRGPIARLGLGERTIDIRAGSAALTLLRDADRLRLWEIHLAGGVDAKDRDGAGYLRARSVLYNETTQLFEASGQVRAKSAEGLVEARRLLVEAVGETGYDLLVDGPNKRVEYVADGSLGPLGKDARGTLVIRSLGPLRGAIRGQGALFKASRRVRVELGETSRLLCQQLSVFLRARKLRTLDARGEVTLEEGGRNATLEGDSLLYREGIALLRGSPARARAGTETSIRARTIVYEKNGQFVARDAVAISAAIQGQQGSGRWRIYCDQATGLLRDKASPVFLQATGTVIALGPLQQHFSGTAFRYDGTRGEARLRGDPAVVQRGKQFRLAAPQIELRMQNRTLVYAETNWPATAEFRPAQQDVGGRSLALWKLAFDHPASFDGKRLLLPAGAKFAAYDGGGALQIDGRAGRLVVRMAEDDRNRRAGTLTASKGVDVSAHGPNPARVTAQRLTYDPSRQVVDVRGNARVRAEGWPKHVRFSHLLFALTKDGVDLKSASDVFVKESR